MKKGGLYKENNTTKSKYSKNGKNKNIQNINMCVSSDVMYPVVQCESVCFRKTFGKTSATTI